MNVHPVNMYWSYYLGFSRIPRPQGRDFFVGKIPKGLLFEVLAMRVMKVTNLRAYHAGKKAMRLVTVWLFTMFLVGGGMVERMSQASGSNVVNCTSTGKLKWYLTCIYQRWEVLLERLNDHPSPDSTFLMLKFGLGNHSTCRDYHHYHYPNYCNLAEGSNRLVAWSCLGAVLFFPDAQCMAYLPAFG